MHETNIHSTVLGSTVLFSLGELYVVFLARLPVLEVPAIHTYVRTYVLVRTIQCFAVLCLQYTYSTVQVAVLLLECVKYSKRLPVPYQAVPGTYTYPTGVRSTK